MRLVQRVSMALASLGIMFASISKTHAEPYTVYYYNDFSDSSSLNIGDYSNATHDWSHDRVVLKGTQDPYSTCDIQNTEPAAGYRATFDLRRPTGSTEDFEVLLRRYWSPTGSTYYQIYTDDDFENIGIYRVTTGSSYSAIELNSTTTSIPAFDYSLLKMTEWHRIETTISDVGGNVVIRLFIDGRLKKEVVDTNPLAWADENDPNDSYNTFRTFHIFNRHSTAEIDNLVFDNAPNYTGDGVIDHNNSLSPNHQEFADIDFSDSSWNQTMSIDTSLTIANEKLHFSGASFEQFYFTQAPNLSDYNYSFDINYPSSYADGTQNIIVRRQWDNYQYTPSGYDFSRDHGYLIGTSDRFNTIFVSRMKDGVSETLLTTGLSTSLAQNTNHRIRISTYGNIIDFYIGDERIFSLQDNEDESIRFGSPSFWGSNTHASIDNLIVDTDYYFWRTQLDEGFVYRGQRATPNGYNLTLSQVNLGEDIYNFDVTNPANNDLSQIKTTMRQAHLSGARLIRFLPRVGYICLNETCDDPTNNLIFADLMYSLYHSVRYGTWAPTSTDPEQIIELEKFEKYFHEVLDEARKYDMFVELVLCDPASEIWDQEGFPSDITEDATPDIRIPIKENTFLRDSGVFDHFAWRASDIIEPFKDEPIVASWEYFNEPPVSISGKKDNPTPYNWGWFYSSPTTYDPDGVKSFFVNMTRVLTDVYEEPTGLPRTSYSSYRVGAKQIFSSGISAAPLAGFIYVPGTVDSYTIELTTLANDSEFRRFEAFVDDHNYVSDGCEYQAWINWLEGTTLNYDFSIPSRMGEVGYPWDYTGNTQIDDVRNYSQLFRYELWTPWFTDISNITKDRHIPQLLWGFGPTPTDSFGNQLDYAVNYDPINGTYTGFDSWITILDTEPNMHKHFRKQSVLEWGTGELSAPLPTCP